MPKTPGALADRGRCAHPHDRVGALVRDHAVNALHLRELHIVRAKPLGLHAAALTLKGLQPGLDITGGRRAREEQEVTPMMEWQGVSVLDGSGGYVPAMCLRHIWRRPSITLFVRGNPAARSIF